ncbi:hypothetical protein [Undibacterium sp. TC9W]|uniref:hypothetical protein n=1 Tax=Undibacterium sp. TC9W TaxID=3413053 RepID=UPI003BF14CD9
MDPARRYEIAIRARSILEQAHDSFMEAVKQLTYQEGSPHKLHVEDNELVVDCLGVRLSAKHRLLVRDGDLMGIEYKYCARLKDEDVEVWKMYVDSDNYIFEDALFKETICQATNKYLADRIIPRIGVALLKSPVFAQANEIAHS